MSNYAYYEQSKQFLASVRERDPHGFKEFVRFVRILQKLQSVYLEFPVDDQSQEGDRFLANGFETARDIFEREALRVGFAFNSARGYDDTWYGILKAIETGEFEQC